ncbi:hypothetical protein SAMN04488540_10399 [Ferrimonas sediminum]|uniref:DUF2057 domain-containing protein n=1 Tax=Ferrimonas sediminum TaxID=718193 RepID=A0A1G8NE57_9GAMM|nr:DUF2057 family protein [Ferrimonas sediminum]SDI78435.1 hypothetical protein SAMN04488540_10399 [Ferrimonas sediminum]
MNTLMIGAALVLASATTTAATLQLPLGFEAMNVNGEAVSGQQNTIELGQGKQVVTLRYINPFISHPEANDHYTSAPIHLVFNADQGEYRIELKDRRAYQAYGHDLKFQIEQNGQAVPSKRYSNTGAIAVSLLAD